MMHSMNVSDETQFRYLAISLVFCVEVRIVKISRHEND